MTTGSLIEKAITGEPVPDRRMTRAASATTAAGGVRAFVEADIAPVADLFQRTFRERGMAAPPSLRDYFQDLFFRHPWQDTATASLVFADPHDRAVGFIGLLPVAMRWRGEALRAAVAGALMVDSPRQYPTAGARLVRSALEGPHQLTFSESASALSRTMWERVGARAMPAYNMDFVRVLRPLTFPFGLLAQRLRIARLLPPVVAPLDRLLHAAGRNPLAPDQRLNGRVAGIDADDRTMADAIPDLVASYHLRPDWDAGSLAFFLRHAAVKERYGRLVRRLVLGRDERPVGGYLYYVKRHGIGFVLQMLARPGHADAVLNDLLVHAHAAGVVAVKGRAQPEWMDALLRHRCVFWNGGSTVVHARNPALMDDILAGHALITGLAAEAWTRLVGGTFAR